VKGLIFSVIGCVSYVRNLEIRTTEPFVPGSRTLEVEIAIPKFKKRKSPGSNQIPSEPIEARGEVLLSSINLLNLFGIRKNNLIYAMCAPVYKKGEETDSSNYRGMSLVLIS
jgi:hypothetical protein